MPSVAAEAELTATLRRGGAGLTESQPEEVLMLRDVGMMGDTSMLDASERADLVAFLRSL